MQECEERSSTDGGELEGKQGEGKWEGDGMEAEEQLKYTKGKETRKRKRKQETTGLGKKRKVLKAK